MPITRIKNLKRKARKERQRWLAKRKVRRLPSDIINRAVRQAMFGKQSYNDNDSESLDAAGWFAMYQAQCSATDDFAKRARAKEDSELKARIKDLEQQNALLNKRITERNEAEILKP